MSTNGNTSCCEFCKHYKKGVQLGEGDCRRYPPIVTGFPTKGSMGQTGFQTVCIFPTVKDESYCGEFLAKETILS